jgi:hypothetical protein
MGNEAGKRQERTEKKKDARFNHTLSFYATNMRHLPARRLISHIIELSRLEGKRLMEFLRLIKMMRIHVFRHTHGFKDFIPQSDLILTDNGYNEIIETV